MRFFTSVLVFFSVLLSALGIQLPIEVTVAQPDSEWADTVQQNYAEFLSEIDGDENKIPLIISSDQHGSVDFDSPVFELINSTVDWSKISKIISLGDTTELALNLYELEEYKIATSCLPQEKRIDICGNHDGHIVFTPVNLSRYYTAAGAVGTENMDVFTVTDTQFGVTYLAIDPMAYPWTYKSGKITTEQADFIVTALTETDETDIILISHPYLFRDNLIKRDGTVFTGSEYFIGSAQKDVKVKESFIAMLAARKNKTAGVFTDSQGVEHPYDFTACQSDFLMTLHGHHHTEGYETCNGITEFLVQGFAKNNEDNSEPNCFYFAYIDKEAKTFKCWKNIPGYQAWEIGIG